MKKKAIENIPYRTAEKAEKKYSYIAAAFIQDIKGTDHLLIEIYKNNRKSRGIPCLRMTFTKEDWGLYWPEKETWSSGSFQDVCGRNEWESPNKGRDSETFMTEAEQDLIWEFCEVPSWFHREYHSWMDCLSRLIDSIRAARRTKRDENRRKRLKDRIENTPDLPGDLEEWADKQLFPDHHFLYYKRKGRYADIACSACGEAYTIATRRKNTFEGQFESVIDEPRNGHNGKCPKCGAFGTWKAKGKTKGVYALDRYCFIGQPYKETGAVIRYVQIKKLYQLKEHIGEKDAEMIGAKESYIITEIARRYLEKGRKPQTDFHKCSSYSGDFWDDCNLYGNANIFIRPALAYEKTYQLLAGTILQYSGAQEFGKAHREYNMMDYMERYTEWPQIEMFSKMGLYGVVEEMVNSRCGIIADNHAKRPEDFLGIRKCRLKLLAEKEGNPDDLKAMKTERKLNANWTYKELTMVRETEVGQGQLELALKYMSMQQLTNKLEKYAGCEIPESPGDIMCGRACEALKTTARTYFDHLSMRERQGYDLYNSVYLFPRNLQQAHDLMVNEVNKGKAEKRDLEVEVKYPNIKKNYRKLRNRYFYEDESYLIRPARSASEITREGRTLHHCVGGDNYLQKHDAGESIILFLRIPNIPEVPYVTIEICGTRIIQWHGAYNRQPEKDGISKWLKGYTEYLEETKEQQMPIAQ